MPTIHFSTCERVLQHYGRDSYVLVRLPFVLTEQEEYPRSFEILIKESLDPPATERAVEILAESAIPVPVDELKEIARDFYCSVIPTPNAPIPRDKNGQPEVQHRSYSVNLH